MATPLVDYDFAEGDPTQPPQPKPRYPSPEWYAQNTYLWTHPSNPYNIKPRPLERLGGGYNIDTNPSPNSTNFFANPRLMSVGSMPQSSPAQYAYGNWMNNPEDQQAYFDTVGGNGLTTPSDLKKVRKFWKQQQENESARAWAESKQTPAQQPPVFDQSMIMGDWKSPLTQIPYYRNDFDGQLIGSPLLVGVAGPEQPRISVADSTADLNAHRAMWAQQDAQQLPAGPISTLADARQRLINAHGMPPAGTQLPTGQGGGVPQGQVPQMAMQMAAGLGIGQQQVDPITGQSYVGAPGNHAPIHSRFEQAARMPLQEQQQRIALQGQQAQWEKARQVWVQQKTLDDQATGPAYEAVASMERTHPITKDTINHGSPVSIQTARKEFIAEAQNQGHDPYAAGRSFDRKSAESARQLADQDRKDYIQQRLAQRPIALGNTYYDPTTGGVVNTKEPTHAAMPQEELDKMWKSVATPNEKAQIASEQVRRGNVWDAKQKGWVPKQAATPTVSNKDDYAKLPSGAIYVGSDGKTYRKK